MIHVYRCAVKFKCSRFCNNRPVYRKADAKMKAKKMLAALLAASLGLLPACGNTSSTADAGAPEASATDESGDIVDLGGLLDEGVPLAGSPALSNVLEPVAGATDVKSNASACIDMSNKADGYVMIKYTGGSDAQLKARVTGPSGTVYTYNLRADGQYDTFPLSDGNGSYTATVYKNISGTSYSTVLSAKFSVSLIDEFAPFLRPNQYVNFNANSQAVTRAAQLTAGMTDNLEKVQIVYNFVISNITYDRVLAANVQSGYLPDVDAVLEKGKGICFDYAAVMAAMLRSQGVPTKLVVGYTGKVYHAWLNVYSEETGWVDGIIYFDGSTWKLMDPTFASSNKSSDSIMKYIGNGANYQAKYLY